MELLSPAGNREALVAAISCGADAVYLGYTAFGARSYAGNFDADGLYDAVAYAHERGRKIYVTVNTLIKQCELDDLCDVFELLSNVGVDAVLVQDLGAVRIAQARFPQLTLHTSTQMTINNAQGAKLMKDLGFSRVVPARECSLEELRRIADTGVEVEAFAHGALCVAVSGQCLFSSMIGGRSGNRGRCAQPCRLPYTAQDGSGGYLLSTKDLMMIDRIPDLQKVGVCSLKLEGRMKRPEYVGVITKTYREAVDAALAGVPYRADEGTRNALLQVFNRGGFTEGYMMGKSNAALMSWQRPNHWGIRVGKVLSSRGPLAKVLLEKDLHDGDGLQVRGKQEVDMTYSGNDTQAGNEATVRIATGNVKQGDSVYRLTDALQMKEIRAYMAQEHRLVPLDAKLNAMPGAYPILTLADREGHSVTVKGSEAVLAAQQRPMDEASAMRQLGKMGGTPYTLASLSLETDGAFMTTGMLNALRRDALEQMRAARTQVVRPIRSAKCLPAPKLEQEHLLIAQGELLSDAEKLLEAGADVFYWQPQVYQIAALEKAVKEMPNGKVAFVLPSVLHSTELAALHTFVCEYAERFCGLVVNNLSGFELDWPIPIWGGQGLNVMNGECARFYETLGAKRLTVSCELSLKELRELSAAGGNFEVEVYGRTQLMLLSHCPRRTRAGDTVQDAACNACAAQDGCPDVYTDRKGFRFPLRRQKMEHGCVVRLYNSVVTDATRHMGKLRPLGFNLRLTFTDETISRRIEMVKSFRHMLNGGTALHEIAENATAGQLLRGVE